MNKMEKCKTCGVEVAKSAKTCPSCGAKIKKPIYTKWWIWLIAVIIIGSAIGSTGDKPQPTPSNTATQTEKKSDTPQEAEHPSIEHKNALKKAENYSKTLHMSKQGIYDQLVSEYGEQFSAEVAQYAIDNLKVDYNENALKKAKTYQSTMSMSKKAIYDQLVSDYGEKFTAEEAQYAIDNLDN